MVFWVQAAIRLAILALVPVAEARTATRTPDELVCLPLVVDYEGYALLAGLVCGAIVTGIYIAIVRREGRAAAMRRHAEDMAEHDGVEHHSHYGLAEDGGGGGGGGGDVREQDHAMVGTGGGGGGTVGAGGHTSSANTTPVPMPTDNLTLEAASDPAVRQALRTRAAEEAPEPPPRR